MPASLTWIDHDHAARERTQRVLALFRERESRDELGLGSIYGSISDQLFPGTSTIQTRLRYMLFVPWGYRLLAQKDGVAAERASKELEQTLIDALLEAGETTGILGQRAREGLKRYPSDVYWAGLGEWGIRTFRGSREELHEDLGRLDVWDAQLPPIPPSFPRQASFLLSTDEASYVRDKLVARHRDSLLTHVALHPADVEDVNAPWELPRDVLSVHRDLVLEARRFATAMQGAAFLYNLMLAEKAENQDYRKRYELALAEWAPQGAEACAGWSLDAFWPKVLNHGHQITFAARAFVTEWVDVASRRAFAALVSPEARKLVSGREMKLKGAQSRFKSTKALQRWGGAAGVGLNTYRWRTARQFLRDLYGARG